jgi:arylsulfatase A-like enzyme
MRCFNTLSSVSAPPRCPKGRHLLLCALLVMAGVGTSIPLCAASPNVVLVMSDDQGWGDVSYHGHERLKTPHLDKMASDGIRLERFYSAAPVCSPTRGSMLTGRHPYRYGIFFANVGHLPSPEVTIAELLVQKGYATGHFGKWHLGTLTTTLVESNRGGPRGKKHYCPPGENGFQEWFSTEAKTPTWDPMWKPRGVKRSTWWTPVEDKTGAVPYGTNYWHNGKRVTRGLNGDDSRVIMDRAIPFIEQAARNETPFLAVIWFHAPHLPVVSGNKYTAGFSDLDPHVQQYYGCLAAMDEQVGRLRAKLESLGVSDNTLLWFCSDNGPEGKSSAPGSTGGLRGRKRSLYEGGVRVPGIVCWPGHVEPGSRSIVPATTSDCLPTIAAAAGLRVDPDRPLDGIDIRDLLDGSMESRPRPIGFQTRGQVAWLDNQFKLVSKTGDDGKIKPPELYNLQLDPAEKNNIAVSESERVSQMIQDLEAWRASCRKSLAQYQQAE